MSQLIAGVTGGARGIGKAYVESLISRGYNVCIFEIAGAVDAAATYNNPNVIGLDVDVSNKVSFRTAFDSGLQHFGGATAYHVFICNAGIVAPMFDQAERQVQTNLMGAIYGIEMAIKSATSALKQQSSTSSPSSSTCLNVIVTASTNGIVPADSDLAPVYVATKFALIGLVRSLQPLHSRFGVRVNAIAPVTVETPMVQDLLPPEAREFLDREGRGGVMAPETCSRAMEFILDSPNLAGEVIAVHPNAPGGKGFAIEPLIASNWLGNWRADSSAEVAGFVDEGLEAVATGAMPGWSGI